MEVRFRWHYSYTLTFIILCLLPNSVLTAAKHSIISDRDALLSLKDHITLDPNQILSKNWSTSSTICNWIGVSCGLRHYRVTALNISNMGLTGTIAPQLGNLSFLASLDLSGNNFHGVLPYELAQLSRLKRLDFSVNAISGELPSWVGSFKELEYLYFNNNTFTSSIPSSISNLTKLKALVCYQNELSGSIPLEIFNISSLEILIMDNNRLSGNLPTTMCRNLAMLKIFKVWSNMLSGQLPSDLLRCSQLTYIDLSHNNFSGNIPKDFWNMKTLEEAYFDYNSLQGTIPKEISNLANLQVLHLRYNNLTGSIPKEIGNMTMLTSLIILANNLRGTIPNELENLRKLEVLDLRSNELSGSVPVGLFNMSKMRDLDLSGNDLSGGLPSAVGFGLPKLEFFSFHENRLSGFIPLFISNSSRLRILDLAGNDFRGTFPHYFGNLRFLELLNLGGNNLTRDSSSVELEFFRPLANCINLKTVGLSRNPLNGVLPKSIGNLSKSIETIVANGCGISGEIPASIGNLSELVMLEFYDNQFTGSLPASTVYLQNLQYLSLGKNKISGFFECDLFHLQSLSELYLFNNLYSGPIPECIGNITSLRKVWLNGNKFNSILPVNLWNLKDLLELKLSSNFFNGSLPMQVGNLKVLTLLDLSMNNFSGNIPDAIGNLQNLVYLDLYHNILEGSIPDSIGRILSLEELDLSQNNLSGSIPISLEKLHYLKTFNVSYNNLDGSIPSGGPFRNFTVESFIFNKALCGDKRFHVHPCPAATSPRRKWIKRPSHIFILSFSLVAFIAAITVVAIYLISRKKNKVHRSTVESELVKTKDRISFYELQHATDRYNERNFLGQGGFGSVYKGTLRDGRVVAVKVFNVQAQEASKSFDVECEMLRNLRHRNLTQVISSCSNLDFKAIVLEFMPNGSLDNWLHSENRFLSFKERLNIMIDVASALQYLHSGYPTSVVHADLKPSNILLDEDMVAHVSDFGVAKMLEDSSIAYTNTLATFGYIAPEYGMEGLVSTRCDIYSFGIILIEVFTRKRPSDETFNDSLTLHGWVNDSVDGGSMADIIDSSLFNTIEEKRFDETMNYMTMIMNIALNCTKDIPKERSDIGEVIGTLNKIKLKL